MNFDENCKHYGFSDRTVRRWGERLDDPAKLARNFEMQAWIAEIQLRAKRRIGEISRELETHERARTDLRSSGETQTKSAVLKEAGIAKVTAHRYEQIASVPEHQLSSRLDNLNRAAPMSLTAPRFSAHTAAPK